MDGAQTIDGDARMSAPEKGKKHRLDAKTSDIEAQNA
jgi:hypothetical protein